MQTIIKNKAIKSNEDDEKKIKITLKNQTLLNGKIVSGEIEVTREEYGLLEPFLQTK